MQNFNEFVDNTKVSLKAVKYLRYPDSKLSKLIFSFKEKYNISDADWVELVLLSNVIQLRELHLQNKLRG